MKKKIRCQAILPKQWNPTRLKSLLHQLSKQKILVIGDVGVDRYTEGLVERISPEAPVPIVLVEEERFKLGLASNVAENIRALKAKVSLAGIVGKDHGAKEFKKLCRKSGIQTQAVLVDATRRTILKERIVSDRQQLLRVDYETLTPVSESTRKKALVQITKLLPRFDAVILEDYAKGFLGVEFVKQLFKRIEKAQKWAGVDPNSKSPLAFYRGARFLTPNTKEAEALSGIKIDSELNLIKAGQNILEKTQAKELVITRGKDGMAVFSKNDPVVSLISTTAREVYDVSGAGDTVIAVMSLAMAAQASIVEAAILGNLAAGVVVGKRGTATVSNDEIRQALEFQLAT